MLHLLVVLGVIAGAAYVALLLVAWRFGERLMFPAPASSYRAESVDGLVTLTASDGTRFAALHLPHARARYTILYSHGNGEDLGNVLPILEALQRLGFAVFAYDYRGYGTSEGSPGVEGVTLDAEAAFAHVTDVLGVPADRLILWGRSIGGGPTVHLASKNRVAGMVLEATFTSAFCVVTRRRILPFDRFENRRLIRELSVPTLFIHGRKDGIVPFVHGARNFECAAEPKRSLWIDGAGHNDLWLVAPREIGAALLDFASSLAGAGAADDAPPRARAAS
ncbi:MAG TPA: alpha/beta hydrolase [Thermoanaerobaculia bacterium]